MLGACPAGVIATSLRHFAVYTGLNQLSLATSVIELLFLKLAFSLETCGERCLERLHTHDATLHNKHVQHSHSAVAAVPLHNGLPLI